MRVFKTNPARVLLACVLAAGLGVFASTSVAAQTYVPTAPPSIAADGSSVNFTGLIPGDTVVASFALSSGAVVTVTGTVDAAGNVIFSAPANAVGVTVTSAAGAATSAAFTISQPAPAATPVPSATQVPAQPAAAVATATPEPAPAQAAAPAQPAAPTPAPASGGALGEAPDNLAFADGDLGDAPEDLAYSGSSTATPAILGISLIILGMAALYVSGHRPERFARNS